MGLGTENQDHPVRLPNHVRAVRGEPIPMEPTPPSVRLRPSSTEYTVLVPTA